MVEQIIWPLSINGEFRSPFQRGEKERALRITFHAETLKNPQAKEKDATGALFELARLADIDVKQVGIGDFPSISVDEKSIIYDYTSRVQLLSEGEEQDVPEFIAARDDFLAIEAHREFNRDVFITLSPRLLKHRDCFNYANIRTPSEALKIVSLFLRSRGNWIILVRARSRVQVESSLFYRHLALYKLLNVREYLGMHHTSIGEKWNDVRKWQGSVLTKFARALQSRDLIGTQFYIPKTRSVEDTITYHFDYLTLLLQGCLDSQAATVNQIYQAVAKDDQRKFQNEKFRKQLRSKGAVLLCDFLESPDFKNFDGMLRAFRNTIHDVGIPTELELDLVQERFDLRVDEFSFELRKGIGYSKSNCKKWGLKRQRYVSRDNKTGKMVRFYSRTIEPYTFAMMLVETTAEILNTIVDLMDADQAIEDAPTITRNSIEKDILERIGLLG